MKKGSIILFLLILVLSLTACMNPEKKALKAFQLVEEQKYDEAIIIYNEILEKDPENIEVYMALANTYSLMGREDLQKKILEKGIREIGDNTSLKFTLADYYVEKDLYEEGEKMFLDILKDDDKNLIAYESLLEMYTETYDNDKIMDLYKKYDETIPSEKATILVTNIHVNMGEVDEASKLIQSIDLDKVEDSNILEKLANVYVRLGNNDKAMLVANKGLKSDKPAMFHGIIYGLTNQDGLRLVTIETGDINGDGKEENVLLMADGDSGFGSEIIELFIQEGETGKIIDNISLSEIGGYPNGLSLADLNQDGVLDILSSVHSGGTGGMEFHYGYSYKDNTKVDILDSFMYNIDFVFLDGHKVKIFSEGIDKAFEVEMEGEQKQTYIEDGYYTPGGMVTNSMYGYFRGEALEAVLIPELNQYGLKLETGLVGPSYNSDYIAFMEVIFLFKDGKWTTYDLNVEQDENDTVSLIDSNSKIEEPVLGKSFERLEKIFSMTQDDIYKKYGTPIETGWYSGEYIAYKDMIYFVDNNKVTGVMLPDGDSIFGIKLDAKTSEIKAVLGKPEFEGFNEHDGDYNLYYRIGTYDVYFSSLTKDGKYDIKILQK